MAVRLACLDAIVILATRQGDGVTAMPIRRAGRWR